MAVLFSFLELNEIKFPFIRELKLILSSLLRLFILYLLQSVNSLWPELRFVAQ